MRFVCRLWNLLQQKWKKVNPPPSIFAPDQLKLSYLVVIYTHWGVRRRVFRGSKICLNIFTGENFVIDERNPVLETNPNFLNRTVTLLGPIYGSCRCRSTAVPNPIHSIVFRLNRISWIWFGMAVVRQWHDVWIGSCIQMSFTKRGVTWWFLRGNKRGIKTFQGRKSCQQRMKYMELEPGRDLHFLIVPAKNYFKRNSIWVPTILISR